MNTAIEIQNILDSIKTLSPEDRILLLQQLQNQKKDISSDNPWIKLAGKYEHDPMYDEVLSYIQEYRHQLDSTN
jgi:hypothetical protein